MIIYSWTEISDTFFKEQYTYIEHHNKKRGQEKINPAIEWVPVHSFLGLIIFDKTAYSLHAIYKEKWCYLVMTFFMQGSCIFVDCFCHAPSTLDLWGSRSSSSSPPVLLETSTVLSTKQDISACYHHNCEENHIKYIKPINTHIYILNQRTVLKD